MPYYYLIRSYCRICGQRVWKERYDPAPTCGACEKHRLLHGEYPVQATETEHPRPQDLGREGNPFDVEEG